MKASALLWVLCEMKTIRYWIMKTNISDKSMKVNTKMLSAHIVFVWNEIADMEILSRFVI